MLRRKNDASYFERTEYQEFTKVDKSHFSQRKITLKITVTLTALNRPVPQVHHLSVTTSSQSHQMNLTRLLLHCHEKKK